MPPLSQVFARNCGKLRKKAVYLCSVRSATAHVHQFHSGTPVSQARAPTHPYGTVTVPKQRSSSEDTHAGQHQNPLSRADWHSSWDI